MSKADNVKVLVWIQIFTFIAVILFVWFYIDPAQTAARGTVEGIIYCIEDSTALVDGLILKEGDTLYGVRIVKIDRGKVTFEKGDERWEQRIREMPNPKWNQEQEE